VVDGNKHTYWATNEGVTSASFEVDLNKPATFNISMVQEHIALGQHVEEYCVEAWDGHEWRQISKGTTIGHKKLDRFPEITAIKIRLSIISSRKSPLIQTFGLYHAPEL
jgi:alpha-L-fucosidase